MIAPMWSALRRTARTAAAPPGSSLWTMLALTCALFAVAVAGIAAENLAAYTRAPRGHASMVIYLGESVDDAHAHAMVGELTKLAGVERAELVSAAETAHRLQVALATGTGSAAGDQLITSDDAASLPASIEVTLAPGVRDVIEMSPTLRSLRSAPGVDDVVIEPAGEDHGGEAFEHVRAIAWTCAALFAGLALIVVLATVRVRLDRGRREVAVARLLGAEPTFLAVPTALAGALHGAFAAGLAAALAYVGMAAYGRAIGEALADALGAIEIAFPPATEVALFVVVGAVIGLVGGCLAGASRGSRASR